MHMVSVEEVTDYIISRLLEGERELSLLKLQKLLYYTQAWYLVHHHGNPLFREDFEAWVHGPVCRAVYNRFCDKYRLYDTVNLEDAAHTITLSCDDLEFINEVLDVYAHYTGSQLEQLTHQERPWRETRGSIPLSARCDKIIPKDLMRTYYGARVGLA